MTAPAKDEDTDLLLQAFFDGELDAAGSLEMERRLAGDAALAGRYGRLVELRGVLRAVPRASAPRGLRDAMEALAAAPPLARGRFSRSLAAAFARPGLAMAACLVLGLALGGGLTYTWVDRMGHSSEASSAALEAVLAGHLRGLASGNPFDVASSDRHTVKPWFAGRVSFAPVVVDLSDSGFPLAGGRIDILAGRAAATLVFRRDRHVISVTETLDPGGRIETPVRTSLRGFTAVHWSAAGIAYWAVSDAAPEEVDALVAAFRAKS